MPTPQEYALALGGGLRQNSGQPGVAPFGLRHSGVSPKGMGFFGPIPTPSGQIATEVSMESDLNGRNVEFPLLVPTLAPEEISAVIGGGGLEQLPQSAVDKASSHAMARILRGQSPFAGPQDLRFPIP